MVMICDWQRGPGLDVRRLSFSVVCFYSNAWESFYDLCKWHGLFVFGLRYFLFQTWFNVSQKYIQATPLPQYCGIRTASIAQWSGLKATWSSPFQDGMSRYHRIELRSNRHQGHRWTVHQQHPSQVTGTLFILQRKWIFALSCCKIIVELNHGP